MTELIISFIVVNITVIAAILNYINGKPENKSTVEIKTDNFTIEHYPLTGRFYPKHKGLYLKKRYNTGIVENPRINSITYADYGKTLEEAKEIIKLFKEQQLKENVKTIKIDESTI